MMAIDPVCGMEVAVEPAALTSTVLVTDLVNAAAPGRHVGAVDPAETGVERFWFCGRGCMLDFGDEPSRYLDPAFTPSGM